MASCNSLNLILLVVMSTFSCMYCSTSGDTLKPGDTLDSLSYLGSANGNFSLGFYVNFDNSYQLGIWWLGRSDLVWLIPNRCTPSVHPTSSTVGLLLTLDQNKTLKITQKGGMSPLVLASAGPQNTRSSSSASVVATLLDSGNFVLQEVNSDDGSTKRLLWQSFDCPTNTLLPGMKLGVNKITGLTWSLSSGNWSLDWDPKGRRLNISQGGVVHWSSGVFREGRFEFISPDDVFGLHVFNFSVVSNATQDYFTFSTPVSRSEISPWVLKKDGRLSAYGGHDIARADYCNGYNTDQGCQRFATRTTVDQPENIPSTDIALADTKKQKLRIGASIPAALLAVVLCIVCYLRRRRIKLLLSGGNKTKIEKELLDLMASDRSTNNVSGLQNDVKMRHDLRVCSYESVMTATCNFSNENKLGEGGFGPVYKGKLMSGQDIAVKRLSRYSGQGTLEFKNEVKLISELQHTNLVQLLGLCIYGEERMLIYEYMPNRSLDYFIFGWELDYDHLNMNSTRCQLLDWKKRFDIIGGIAQGLLYLHKYSRLRVIHRDLKTSNILLDENMNPKISDFGLARIFTNNERQANTNRVVGTYGYMSPEYAMEGLFSTKSDVYSFGVLMLEIISGRKNSSFYNDDGVLNIVGYAWELWKEGAGLELMDPTLGDSCIRDELLRCIHVGLLCVEENAADRPTMSDVISTLTNESMSLPLPAKPAFFTARKMVGAGICGEEPEIISINGVSNSEFDGR